VTRSNAAKAAVASVEHEKPKPAAKPVRRAKPKFDRKMLSTIKASLLKMQKELQEELAEIEEAAFNVSQSEMSGEVGYDEDYADAGSFTFEREKDLSIANNVQDLLEKISRALEKINDGTYGICENCGQAIEAPRLKALPHALLCVKCKTAEERR
jgi:DnaK suppressor protein